jgi:hypothetical protein
LHRRPGITLLLPFASDRGIDIADPDLSKGAVLLPEAAEKLLQDPTSAANSMQG